MEMCTQKMIAFLKLIYIMYFVVLFKTSELSGISGFIDPKNPSAHILILPEMKPLQGIRSEGIFERFLRNFFDLLSTTFPERKLTRYCRVLSRELENMEYKHTRRLAKHVRHLSRMYREDLKNEVKNYREELDKRLSRRTEFLHAMNDIFTLRENQLFDDYIYDLRDFGTEDKANIDEETRKLLNDVIVGSVLKASKSSQKQLLRKFRRAIKEYTKLQ